MPAPWPSKFRWKAGEGRAIFHRVVLVEYRREESAHPGSVTGRVVLINPQRPVVVINEINGREPSPLLKHEDRVSIHEQNPPRDIPSDETRSRELFLFLLIDTLIVVIIGLINIIR